jgi:hypothetical protein
MDFAKPASSVGSHVLGFFASAACKSGVWADQPESAEPVIA